MSFNKQADFLSAVDALLQRVDSEKTAEANTEAGGYMGATSHPIKSEDDSTQDAQEGARSSENTADVKKDNPTGVENTSESATKGQDKVQTNVGLTSAATGEAPEIEDAYKGGKDDPGSSHPARTDNSEAGGGKYAQLIAELTKLNKQAEEAGAQLLAAIAVEADGEVRKQAQQLSGTPTKSAEEKPAAASEKKAEVCATCKKEPCECAPAADESKCATDRQAGADLAGIFANFEVNTQDKQAADLLVVDTIRQVLDVADRHAFKLASFYHGHFSKKSEEDKEKDQSENPPEGGSEDASGSAAADPAAGGGTLSEQDLLALLNGGEGMGAEDAAAGMDPLAAGAAADPTAGAGAADPLAGAADPLAAGAAADPTAGAGAGGEPSPEDLAMLEAALAQAGVTPEQLQQAIAGKVAAQVQKKAQASKKVAAKPDQQKLAAMLSVIKELVGHK